MHKPSKQSRGCFFHIVTLDAGRWACDLTCRQAMSRELSRRLPTGKQDSPPPSFFPCPIVFASVSISHESTIKKEPAMTSRYANVCYPCACMCCTVLPIDQEPLKCVCVQIRTPPYPQTLPHTRTHIRLTCAQW